MKGSVVDVMNNRTGTLLSCVPDSVPGMGGLSMYQRISAWEGLLVQTELVFPVPFFGLNWKTHLPGHVHLTFCSHFCSCLVAAYYEPGPELGHGFTEVSRLGP